MCCVIGMLCVGHGYEKVQPTNQTRIKSQLCICSTTVGDAIISTLLFEECPHTLIWTSFLSAGAFDCFLFCFVFLPRKTCMWLQWSFIPGDKLAELTHWSSSWGYFLSSKAHVSWCGMQRLIIWPTWKATCLDHRTFLCSLLSTINLVFFLTFGRINCVTVLILPWHD